MTYHEELWQRFIYGAIVVFLLDLLVRRVRIFDRKFVPRGGPKGRSGRGGVGPMTSGDPARSCAIPGRSGALPENVAGFTPVVARRGPEHLRFPISPRRGLRE